MKQFKLVIRRASQELINTVTGHKDRGMYSHPIFVDGYMYLSPYYGDDVAGVYKIERVAGEKDIDIEDISTRE